MRHKSATMGDHRRVLYDSGHWRLLEGLRKRAVLVMLELRDAGLISLVHGSVARGDVSPRSDVDIIIPMMVPSFKVELALDRLGITGRKLVQATPGSMIKAHIYLPHDTMVTIPMTRPGDRELEFYAFGGQLGHHGLEDVKNRVPGVDKRLMLIEPESEGHIETPLSDLSPGAVARKVGVGREIVEERIRVLDRRARVGTTGVYLDRTLAPDEGFEAVLDEVAAGDSLVRRKVRGK